MRTGRFPSGRRPVSRSCWNGNGKGPHAEEAEGAEEKQRTGGMRFTPNAWIDCALPLQKMTHTEGAEDME
jgi:hypothetical protein